MTGISWEESRKNSKGWCWLDTRFVIKMTKSGTFFCVTAMRKDGIYFFAEEEIPRAVRDRVDGHHLLILNDIMQRALEKLDKYLDCECKPGEPCDKHRS